MLLTDYYKFEHKPNTKSKTRLDCVASSKSYNPLEASTNSKGVIVAYIGDNTHTKAGQKGKSDLFVLHRIKSIGTWKSNPYVFAYNFKLVK